LIGTDATAACVGALSSETDPLRRKNLALIIRACPR